MWFILDYLFFAFHSALVLFNTFGWAFRGIRKYNLATLLITGFSWFILGFRYGWGYCFCTDWHWAVRKHLGYYDQTDSYIHFLILKLTGINISLALVENITAAVFFSSLLISVWVNRNDLKKLIR